jgi:DNA-binding transcriptional MerR regulator
MAVTKDRVTKDSASTTSGPELAALPDDGFRGAQVCTLVGITYRQLDYWARTDLLRPSITDATGSGSQRRYSYSDVLELKVIKRLLDAGLKLQQARQAVECLRGDLQADLASSQLVLVGNRSVLAHSDGDVVDLLAGGQGVFNILPLSGVVTELQAAIVEINAAAPAPTTRPQSHPAAHYLASGEAAER